MTVEEILKAPIMMPLNQYQQQTPQLEVTDHGDPSVGIFSGTYKVDVPLSAPFDKEELEFFKAIARSGFTGEECYSLEESISIALEEKEKHEKAIRANLQRIGR